MLRSLILSIVLALLAAVACTAESPSVQLGDGTPVRLPSENKLNLVRLLPSVYSGGLPSGDAAFAELKQLGIKTIISVDGATPAVDNAKRFGLRYVHLPHGYAGISEQRQLELAKAIREFDGPVYIHCHHGKHRSPAAASVACVRAGLMTRAVATKVLKIAGTSPRYRGLHQVVSEAQPVDPAILQEMQVDYRERVQVPPLAATMVDIECIHSNLTKIAAVGWQPPQEHPDADAGHQALLLREQYTELLRTAEAKALGADFLHQLEQAENEAENLQKLLVNREATTAQTLAIQLRRVGKSCVDCHRAFRDVPLPSPPGKSIESTSVATEK